MNSRQDYVQDCRRFVDSLQESGKILIRYMKNKKNQKVGVVAAYRQNGYPDVFVGVSKCNSSSGDRFNKYVGITKAIESGATLGSLDALEVPQSMQELFEHQLGKINRYYNNANYPSPSEKDCGDCGCECDIEVSQSVYDQLDIPE